VITLSRVEQAVGVLPNHALPPTSQSAAVSKSRASGASRSAWLARASICSSHVRRARLGTDVLHDRMKHLPTSATGTGWERTPWHATQRAAWAVLKRADCVG
jgi:hypothetical protein